MPKNLSRPLPVPGRPVALPALIARDLRQGASRECARAKELCSDAEEVAWRAETLRKRCRNLCRR
jgi:hypothetical protein